MERIDTAITDPFQDNSLVPQRGDGKEAWVVVHYND